MTHPRMPHLSSCYPRPPARIRFGILPAQSHDGGKTTKLKNRPSRLAFLKPFFLIYGRATHWIILLAIFLGRTLGTASGCPDSSTAGCCICLAVPGRPSKPRPPRFKLFPRCEFSTMTSTWFVCGPIFLSFSPIARCNIETHTNPGDRTFGGPMRQRSKSLGGGDPASDPTREVRESATNHFGTFFLTSPLFFRGVRWGARANDRVASDG